MSTSTNMQKAVELLSDLGANYEYSGYISVHNLAFGDTNGDYTFNREDGEPIPDALIPEDKWELPNTVTVEELAAWVREVVTVFEKTLGECPICAEGIVRIIDMPNGRGSQTLAYEGHCCFCGLTTRYFESAEALRAYWCPKVGRHNK